MSVAMFGCLKSRPRAGAWIETARTSTRCGTPRSRAHARARGLKRTGQQHDDETAGSRPRAGAWIETAFWPRQEHVTPSRAHARARGLKRLVRLGRNGHVYVAPTRGRVD